MNQQFAKQTLDQAEKLFKETPASMQALAEKGVVATQDLYAKTAAAAQHGAKVLTEIAETAWGSTKMLNEKAVQNLTANVETTFAAARGMASAKSLAEVAKLQSEFVQKFAAQTTEQAREFVDLSTRATQHVFEKVQTAAAGTIKPTV